MRDRISDLFAMIEDRHGVTKAEIKGRSRKRPICYARQHFMSEARAIGLSYPRIGQLLDGRDHATVIHGCKAHAQRAATQLGGVDA